MMKKKTLIRAMLIAGLLVILLSACSEPRIIYENPEHVDFGPEDTNVPEVADDIEEPAAATPAPEEVYFEQDGIRLYYDPQLVLDIDPLTETIPASAGGEMYEMPHPTYVHFDLAMEGAHVYVAPVAEYQTIADFAPGIIADMQRLNDSPANFSDCVAELPLNEFFHMCDHQQFNANLARVDFQNGVGVRFVTVYGIQDFSPVGNETLLYVYQGLTNDGKYYIKVVARIAHVQLPQVGEIPAEVYTAADYSVVEEYFIGFEDLFNQNQADFSPALNWIDAFLASFRVE